MPRVKQTAKPIRENSDEESYDPTTDGRKRTMAATWGGASKRGRTDAGGAGSSRGGAALGRGKGKGLARQPTPQPVTSSEEVSGSGSGSGFDEEATESDEEIEQPGQQTGQQAQWTEEEPESEGEQPQQQLYTGPSRSFRAGRIYMMLLPETTVAAGASVPYYKGDIRRYRQECPYVHPKDPTVPDVRFWDHTQVEFYRNILKKKPGEQGASHEVDQLRVDGEEGGPQF